MNSGACHAALLAIGLAACSSSPPAAPRLANVAPEHVPVPRAPILAVAPPLTIEVGYPGAPKPDITAIEDRVRAIDPRITGIAWEFTGVGFTEHFDFSATMYGVEPAVLRARGLERYIVAGRLDLESGGLGSPVAMGRGLAKRLGVSVDDMITLSIGPATSVRFHVTGLFEVGLPEYDDRAYFAAYDIATQGQGVNVLGAELKDPADARDVADRLAKARLDKEWGVAVKLTPWR